MVSITSIARRFLLCLVLLFPLSAVGQVSKVLPQPQCSIAFSFTAVANTVNFDNRQLGCAYWTVSYAASGFSALSLVLQSADDSAGAPGTFGTFVGTAAIGVNPAVSTTSAFAALVSTSTYNPWVRMRLDSETGTGVITGVAYGWNNNPFGGGASGGAVTPPACTLFASVSSAATSSVVIPHVTGKQIVVCNFNVTPASAINIQLTQGTGTACATGLTDLSGVYQLVTSLDLFNPLSPLTAAANQDVCMSLGSAVSTSGTIFYRVN